MLSRFFSRLANVSNTASGSEAILTPPMFLNDQTVLNDSEPVTISEHAAARKKQSPALAVLSAKGGSGASTISINLAAAIAQNRFKSTLIDAHLEFPSIAHWLGNEPAHSLLELVGRQTGVDEQLYRACGAQIDPALGLKFLSPPLDGSAARQITLSDLSLSMQEMRAYSDCWILDVPSQLDKHLVTVLDQCSHIVLVFEATVTGVAMCKRWLEIFRELGYEKDRVVCVLNRAGAKYRAVEEQVDVVLDELQLWHIPNATNLIWQSATEGVPVVLSHPGSSFSRAIFKLAEHLLHSP